VIEASSRLPAGNLPTVAAIPAERGKSWHKRVRNMLRSSDAPQARHQPRTSLEVLGSETPLCVLVVRRPHGAASGIRGCGRGCSDQHQWSQWRSDQWRSDQWRSDQWRSDQWRDRSDAFPIDHPRSGRGLRQELWHMPQLSDSSPEPFGRASDAAEFGAAGPSSRTNRSRPSDLTASALAHH